MYFFFFFPYCAFYFMYIDNMFQVKRNQFYLGRMVTKNNSVFYGNYKNSPECDQLQNP